MDVLKDLEYVIKVTNQEIQRIEDSELLQTQHGKLSIHKVREKSAFVETTIVGDKRQRKILNPKDSRTKELLTQLYLEGQLAAKRENIALINELLPKLRSESADAAISQLCEKLPLFSFEFIESTMKEILWNNSDGFYEKYKTAAYREEGRIHTTSWGLKVRSKSEMMIAESLRTARLKFVYEPEIEISNRKYLPDFVVLSKSGKEFFWEHFGLTNSTNYINYQLEKVKDYISDGIAPWDNLIMSYDTPKGNLDLRIIDSEIANKLLY